MNSIKNILERRSERNYKNIPIEQEKINKLINVINSSPTSNNSQDFSAIIVTNKELREKISLGLETQKHVIEVPLFIIFCADMNRIDYLAQKNNTEVITNTWNNYLTACGDAFIATTFATNAAIQLGLGTCYIGMIKANLKLIQQELKLEGHMVPVIGLTVGYIESQNDVKPKINHVYQGTYNLDQVKKEVDLYDNQMLNYYDKRNANKKYNTWSESVLKSFQNNLEFHNSVEEFIKTHWKI